MDEETRQLWDDLRKREGRCGCPPLTRLFLHEFATSMIYARLDFLERQPVHGRVMTGEESQALSDVKRSAQDSAAKFYYMLMELICEGHVTILSHGFDLIGESKVRPVEWDEMVRILEAETHPITLNCARCGQILITSIARIEILRRYN